MKNEEAALGFLCDKTSENYPDALGDLSELDSLD